MIAYIGAFVVLVGICCMAMVLITTMTAQEKLTVRKLLCAVGIHEWKITQELVYGDELSRRLAIPTQAKQRTCAHCKKVQELDIHCLGLNPPEYVTRWFNI